MSRKVQTYGTIKSGKLGISYRDQFITALSVFPDCRVRVTVEKIYRKRSLEQNAYYFGVVINEFCEGYTETTGEKITQMQAHEILKHKFNFKEFVNQQTGEVLNVPQTTSELTTTQFMEYIEECRRFIAEWFNRYVPAPGEQTEMEFNQ